MICIIPARGGSKGIPGKNMKMINGKPLLWYTIYAAKRCFEPEDIYINTDDESIVNYAEREGVNAFVRGWNLRGDYTSIEDILTEQVTTLGCDNFMYLQPTDIFRTVEQMTECQAKVQVEDYDSAFVGYATHKKYWRQEGKVWRRMTGPGYRARQIAAKIIREDTGICLVSKAKTLLQGNRVSSNCYVVKNEDSYTGLDIHDPQDLALVEAAIEYSRLHKPGHYAFQ